VLRHRETRGCCCCCTALATFSSSFGSCILCSVCFHFLSSALLLRISLAHILFVCFLCISFSSFYFFKLFSLFVSSSLPLPFPPTPLLPPSFLPLHHFISAPSKSTVTISYSTIVPPSPSTPTPCFALKCAPLSLPLPPFSSLPSPSSLPPPFEVLPDTAVNRPPESWRKLFT